MNRFGPNEEVGLEDILVSLADPGVHAVGGDDEIGVGKLQIGLDLPLEHQLHAEPLAAPLQNVEQMLAPDADEAVAGRAQALALEQKLDVVPMVEGVGDLGGALRIRLADRLHDLIGEHDAPAERVVGPVPFDDGNVVLGMPALHHQSEIEPRRPSADANDPHVPASDLASLLEV